MIAGRIVLLCAVVAVLAAGRERRLPVSLA
jgi:hypothetical protein